MKTNFFKYYILLIPFFLTSPLLLCQDDINFKKITPQYNNKNVFVTRTAQDSLGIIWMLSNRQILKYNGYSYQSIKIEDIFPNVKSGDGMNELLSDTKDNIWIKSNNGLLSKYNSSKGIFEDYSAIFKEPISVFKSNSNTTWAVSKNGNLLKYKNKNVEILATLPNLNGIDNKVESIEFGKHQDIYISTSKGKIYNYAIQTKTLRELIGPYTDYPSPIVLKVDNDNKLWIGTETFGLLVYDTQKKKFIHESLFKNSEHDISKEFFINFYFDDKTNNIWGGTDGDGLYQINSKTGEIKVYKKDYANDFSLTSNTIININKDNHDNVWAVTKYGNLCVIPKINKNIHYHKGSDNNAPLRVLSIYKSQDNKLWIGTDGNGVTLIDSSNKTRQFLNKKNNGFYVQSITEDTQNDIWLGTYKNGLWLYNSRFKTFEKLTVRNSQEQIGTDIRTVFTDSKGRIWVGSNVAINIYSSTKKLIASFDYNQKGVNGTIIESMFEDSQNNIWLGVYGGGLFKFNENLKDLKASNFTNYPNNFDKHFLQRVISISKGESNKIWLINGVGKLFLFNTQNGTYESYNHLEELQTVVLQSLISADPYNIWLSSSNGLHHFDKKTNLIRTFYTKDGFRSNNYINRSAFNDNHGVLYFGTNKGLNFFNPDLISKEKSNAILSVNDIHVLNKPARELLKNQINSDIFKLEKLHLEYNQASFSIKFSAIGNILNPSYQYAYKLNGFDEDWTTTYSEGLATYTNIPPGTYTFEIKTNDRNDSTIISKKTISIIIAPPFWDTPIAYFIYILILGILFYSVLKWYYLNKKLLINKISRRKDNELANAKMNFFAKMSHEIQTPITLILGPIEDMITQAEKNGNRLLKERLTIISDNTTRLSKIAKQLTLIRNKELNELKLSVSQNNLHQHITKISSSFKELARNKKIDFSITCPKNLTNLWYDKDKLEHIIYNLLSNAFKYTPKDGNVQLTVIPLKAKNSLKISIIDSGQGIKEEELNNIFKMFYRSSSTKANKKGMGIGLALTKELITLHKGKIKVKSIQGEGTTFIIRFPVDEGSYEDHEKIVLGEVESSTLPEIKNEIELKELRNFDNTKKTILIVEDSFELQNFIKELLENHFNILLADNGKEGFYHAKNNIPDLIISDIMMPEMDGIDMCKELNKNNATKHIPVMLLTAKNSTKAKIEGLKTGAIEYINKPFNTRELILKVNNILTSKENIISKYRKELINKPEIKINKSQDELFLEKLVSTVNNRLSDSSFKVDELSEILNMSYSSLYRKCSSLTGMSVIDFVRHLRLKKAAILMVKYGYSVSEVAYIVGFNDPKYFTKSFKNQFNITPKSFKTESKNFTSEEEFLKNYAIDILEFEDS